MREGGKGRLEEERRRLELLAKPGGVQVSELGDDSGEVLFTVATPDPPGWTVYLTTGPNYPMTAPGVIAEQRNAEKPTSSRTILTWTAQNYLSQVVEDVVNGATRRSRVMFAAIASFAVLLVAVAGIVLVILGQNREDLNNYQKTVVAARSGFDATAAVLGRDQSAAQTILAAHPQDTSAIATLTAIANAKSALDGTATAVINAANVNATKDAATQTAFNGLQGATRAAAAANATANQRGTETAQAVPTPTIPAIPTVLPTSTVSPTQIAPNLPATAAPPVVTTALPNVVVKTPTIAATATTSPIATTVLPSPILTTALPVLTTAPPVVVTASPAITTDPPSPIVVTTPPSPIVTTALPIVFPTTAPAKLTSGVVPNVLGMQLDAAIAKLNEAGFTNVTWRDGDYGDYIRGSIGVQNPVSGTFANFADQIILLISKGSKRSAVLLAIGSEAKMQAITHYRSDTSVLKPTHDWRET